MLPKNKLLYWTVGIFILGTILFMGFSKRISGKVIDASTGQPIADAVVLAQWTVVHSFIERTHSLSKITEVLTDKNGKFIIWGSLNPFTETPEVVIYKKRYVAWRSDYVFPGYVHRSPKLSELTNYVFKLDLFKQEYSVADHASFMDTGIMGRTPHFSRAEDDESIRAQPEIKKRREDLIESALIGSLESITFSKTKYEIHQLCAPIQWVPYGEDIQRLRQEAKIINTKLYTVMKKNNIIMIIEGDKTYFLKTHWN